MAGKVYIVGAGPGAVDLLTLRAHALISSADVLLHDDLVSDEILALAPEIAQIISVGKRCGQRSNSQERINALMIWHAQNGSNVVRLKSGEPGIFGRLGEELDALRRAGIPFEVVPGITAASAAAAAAGISLTDRRCASTLMMATAHVARPDDAALRAHRADPSRTTLVVYMPGPDYGRTAQQLIASGRDANTPCVLVSNAARGTEQVCYMTISDLPFALGIAAPAVVIVGEAARKRAYKPEFAMITNSLEEKYEPVGNRDPHSTY
ncbi:MAG TPA: uroporphyrinogen-III C-methyltransferase [Candidatus Angelobacter sp.]|nr:uroporphyrinogen-III C-methyltransferase [Candidatus Angelobacter sp.]